MAKRHVTMDCPVCGAANEVVADPERGRWICFNCRSTGTYAVTLEPDPPTETAAPEPAE